MKLIFLKNIYKTNKSLARLSRKKKSIQINIIRNERGAITTVITQIQRIVRV